MATIKIDEIINSPEVLLPGNMACAGCGFTIAYRSAISAVKNPIVVIPACCAAVVESAHPNVSYAVNTVNIAFAAHASTASGIARAKQKRGEEATVIVWSGDGGSYDIGFATISGAAERNEDMIHICYDNGFYGNTGAQRSGATPRGAVTTTTPAGKEEKRKSLARIMMMHDIPYIATASSGYPRDLYAKVRRASEIKGFKFILIDCPCPTGWDYDPKLTVDLAKKAVESGLFPLYEYENGKLTFNGKSKILAKDWSKRIPLQEFLKPQGRFKRMKDETIALLEQDIENEWNILKKFSEES